MWNLKKMIQMKLFTKQKQTQTYKTNLWLPTRKSGGGGYKLGARLLTSSLTPSVPLDMSFQREAVPWGRQPCLAVVPSGVVTPGRPQEGTGPASRGSSLLCQACGDMMPEASFFPPASASGRWPWPGDRNGSLKNHKKRRLL